MPTSFCLPRPPGLWSFSLFLSVSWPALIHHCQWFCICSSLRILFFYRLGASPNTQYRGPTLKMEAKSVCGIYIMQTKRIMWMCMQWYDFFKYDLLKELNGSACGIISILKKIIQTRCVCVVCVCVCWERNSWNQSFQMVRGDFPWLWVWGEGEANIHFFFLRFYLFIWQRERQSEREGTQAGGVGEEEAGSQQRSLMWGLIPGLWDHSLSQRQMLKDWATQVPLHSLLY